jgi:hypothetical protein
MKTYGVRLEACIFWNIFGPKYNRILGVFRVYFFRVRLGRISKNSKYQSISNSNNCLPLGLEEILKTGPESTSKLKDIKDTKRQQRQIMTNVEK